MNTTIIITFIIQFVLACIGAGTGTYQTLSGMDLSYLRQYVESGDVNHKGETVAMLLVQQVGTWILIFTNFVPISLLVTLEVVKFW